MRSERYKNIERSVWSAFIGLLGRACNAVSNAMRYIGRVALLRLTVVIVPHSDGRAVNIETSVLSLMMWVVLAVGLAGAAVYSVHGATEERAEVSSLMEQKRDTQASLDELRDANIKLLETAKKFQQTLTRSISTFDFTPANFGTSESAAGNVSGDGDLASLFRAGGGETSPTSVQETEQVNELTQFLEDATAPVEQFGKMFDSRAVLFREIPSIWPVTNPNAHLSMAFGPNVHPITGQWYVHKGLDFSTFRSGDRVVATADGYVAMVGYDLSFGNYVIIKHKHGIYTRYAHMMYSTVKKGQYVRQKDLIGYVGNTGVTTGPHLHYEVHIGSDVVDPARYINVKLFK